MNNSRLAKTCRYMKEMTLPPSAQLLQVTSLRAEDDLNTEPVSKDAWFRAAQKGIGVAKDHFAGLIEGMPMQPDTVFLVVDQTPHAGDRALGLRQWVKEQTKCNTVHYLGVGIKNSPSGKACAFAKARLAKALAEEWTAGTLALTEEVAGKEVPVRADTKVPDPTAEELDNVPGAPQAMEGLQALKLEATTLQGAKVVVKEHWTAEFQLAPFEVACHVRAAAKWGGEIRATSLS